MKTIDHCSRKALLGSQSPPLPPPKPDLENCQCTHSPLLFNFNRETRQTDVQRFHIILLSAAARSHSAPLAPAGLVQSTIPVPAGRTPILDLAPATRSESPPGLSAIQPQFATLFPARPYSESSRAAGRSGRPAPVVSPYRQLRFCASLLQFQFQRQHEAHVFPSATGLSSFTACCRRPASAVVSVSCARPFSISSTSASSTSATSRIACTRARMRPVSSSPGAGLAHIPHWSGTAQRHFHGALQSR